MATILSDGQCSRIKALRKRFRPYADRGWMCEGSDYEGRECNCLFNNDTDESFLADFNGNIINSDLRGTSIFDAVQMATIEGNISRICNE